MTETATMTSELRSTSGRQRMRALERANAVRLARAELKRQIAQGHVSAAEVILRLPAEAESWPVGELLMSQRRWGTNRTRKLLSGLQISEMRPLRLLTERQRRLLATQLGVRAVEDLELAELQGYVNGNGIGPRQQEEPDREAGNGYAGADHQHRFEHDVARVVQASCLAVGAVDVA